jgi:hypothetical protein
MVSARVGSLRACALAVDPSTAYGAREEPSSMRSNRRTKFSSVSFAVYSFAPSLAFAFAVSGLAACSAPATSSTTAATTTSALATGSSGADGGVPAQLTSCLTTYVECVRAASDTATCKSDLHVCLAPPRPDAGGEHGDCGGPDPRGGPGGGPPQGDPGGSDHGSPGDPGDPGGPGGPSASGPDGGGAPPGPPPNGQEPPPLPPGQGDGDGAPPGPPNGHQPPPPPPGDGGAGGPFACFAALDTCAAGTDSVDSCVATAVTCLSAFPPPPPPPHH